MCNKNQESLSSFISVLVGLILVLAIVSPVIALVYGGIKYMTINEQFRKIFFILLIVAGAIAGIIIVALFLFGLILKRIFK